ncbi:glycosyltransferase family 4 protein (plasmid) [Ensifer adhaerens]
MSGELLREIAEHVILSCGQFGIGELRERNHNIFHAPALPIAKSVAIRDAIRRSLNIGDEKLVVAFVEDEKSAGEIISYVRSRTERSKLIVQYVLSPPSMKISQLIGDVWQRYPPELNYDGLLNAADEVLIKEELQGGLQSLLLCDCGGVGIPLNRLSDNESRRETRTNAVSWDARSILDLVLGRPAPSRTDWLSSFMEPVRGILPGAEDVVAAANAIANNESFLRAPGVYIDISSFTRGVGRKPGPRIANFLRGLASLSIGENRVRFCYRKENAFFTGNRFSSNLFALPGDWGIDNISMPKAGDLIVLFDAIAEATIDQDSSYTTAVNRNATIVVLAIEEALRKCVGNSYQLGYLVAEFLLQSRSSIAHSTMSHFGSCGNTANAPTKSRYFRASQLLAASNLPFVGIDLEPPREGGADNVCGEFSTTLCNFWQASERSRSSEQEPYNRFVVVGHMLGTYSLAIINRSVAGALEQAYPGNVRIQAVETIPVSDFSSLEGTDRELVEKLAKQVRPVGRREVAICQHYPIIEPPEADLSLSLLAWEETRLPKQIVDALNANYQGVIAPARSVEKALADSGVRIPIGTIGQPTQSLAYYVDTPRVLRRADQGTMTFLHISSCFPRKGVDVLLRAWQRAFRKYDSVRLIIKTFPNPHNTIESDVSILRVSDKGSAAIEVINQDLNEAEMLDLFKQADAMVLPTRGEGFNLPALEAMLAGVPLIVTGHGGHMDFCSDQNSRLLGYDFARAESHVADRLSLWVNPNEDDLVHALRERVDEACYHQIQDRAARARETALQVADWSAWTDRLDEWLETVQQPPERPRIAWLSTWDVQCGIAQYSSFLIEAMSPEAREETIVLCDSRTKRTSDPGVVPCWSVQQNGLNEAVLPKVVSANAEVIVLQHQDGLISWRELAGFANDPRVRSRTSIFILHNPRGLLVPSPEERDYVVSALRNVDRLLVHSVADVNLLKQFGLVDNVTLFPHGASKGHARARSAVEIINRSPIIGCHGFFFYHKGIEKLVSAVAQLRQQWPGIKLRLLNARFPDPVSDAAIHSCRELVARLGLENAIEWYLDFLPVSEIQAKLADCDLIVLPYEQSQDSASGAARIALSSYSPVVATDVNIFAEFKGVVDMVPNNDPGLLASRIDELLRHPNERLRIQTQADEWLSSHGWQPTSERLEDIIYAQMLKKKMNGGIAH